MRFDQMTKEQRTELARRGGRVAHAQGTGRQWTTEQARAAATKSVLIRKANKLADAANEIAVETITFDQAHGLSLRCPDTLAAFDGPEAA